MKRECSNIVTMTAGVGQMSKQFVFPSDLAYSWAGVSDMRRRADNERSCKIFGRRDAEIYPTLDIALQSRCP